MPEFFIGDTSQFQLETKKNCMTKFSSPMWITSVTWIVNSRLHLVIGDACVQKPRLLCLCLLEYFLHSDCWVSRKYFCLGVAYHKQNSLEYANELALARLARLATINEGVRPLLWQVQIFQANFRQKVCIHFISHYLCLQ